MEFQRGRSHRLLGRCKIYFQLTENVQRRFILELRRYWSYHPKFRDDLVKNIQGKYSFRERPQMGIIVKNASGNQVRLAPDNFQGTLKSYVLAARVEKNPGLFLEWVREDSAAIKRNGGVFPTAPGVYYLTIEEVAENMSSFTFFIDPLLDVRDETLMMVNPTTGRVGPGKFLEGSLTVFLMPGNIELKENINYTTDPETGEINFFTPLAGNDFYSVDYRWPATAPGESPAVLPNDEPWTGVPNRGLIEPLPGVVLAFGRRIEAGDVMAVVVSRERQIAAREFGGRWDLSLDFDVVARDPHTQREILDQTVMYIANVLRSRLSSEGMEIDVVTMGGETEEIAYENSDDYFYGASFSVTVQTDWSLHVPVAAMIQRVEPTTAAQAQIYAGLSDEEIAAIQTNLQGVSSLLALQNGPGTVEALGLGLRSFRDPFFKIGATSFEKLS